MCRMRGGIRMGALVLAVLAWGSVPLGASAAKPQGSVIVRSLWSRALQHHVRTLVYLPPAYRPGGPRLPTLYLLHGTPGTPDGLFALGVGERLDSLIDSGGAPAMIVVAPSGGRRARRRAPSRATRARCAGSRSQRLSTRGAPTGSISRADDRRADVDRGRVSAREGVAQTHREHGAPGASMVTAGRHVQHVLQSDAGQLAGEVA